MKVFSRISAEFVFFASSLLLSQMLAAQTGPITKPVQVYSHRGARAFAPEHTMAAYKAALRLGTEWVDMDVALTKDGLVLVTHDLVVNSDIARGPDGKFIPETQKVLKKLSLAERAIYDSPYVVKNMSFAETQKFDVGRLNPDSAYSRFFPDQLAVDGSRMPLLSEVVRYVNKISKNKVGFQIEMKTDPRAGYSPDPEIFARTLYKILKDENILRRTEVQAFDFRCLYALQKLDSGVKTAYLTSRDNEPGGSDSFFSDDEKSAGRWTGGKMIKDYGGTIPQMVKNLGGYAWEPEDAELTKESLDEAHKLGLKVVVWSWPEKLGSAFDPALVTKMIDWGVDGIITDDPGRLYSMLSVRGQTAPPAYKAE